MWIYQAENSNISPVEDMGMSILFEIKRALTDINGQIIEKSAAINEKIGISRIGIASETRRDFSAQGSGTRVYV